MMTKLLLEEIIDKEECEASQKNADGAFFDIPTVLTPREVSEAPYTRAHIIGALAIVLIATGIGFSLRSGEIPATGPTIVDIRASKHTAVSTPSPRDYFSGIALQARSAYVLDATTGKILFEKNAHMRLPLASITKVMTALIAAEEFPRDRRIVVRPEDVAIEGDSGLQSSEQFRLRDILDLTLVGSSNDGAHAIAASVGSTLAHFEGDTPITEKEDPEDEFILRMNERARTLGLTGTSYLNATGLDHNDSEAGAYGSARDTAELFSYALRTHPEIFSATASVNITVSSLALLKHTATNTNEHVMDVPGIIASKTGYTTLAGGNLAVALDAGLGRPIVVVVLGSTAEGRFSDVENLARAAIKTISVEWN